MKTAVHALFRIVLPVAAILFLMLWVTGRFHRGVIQGAAQPAPEPGVAGLPTATVTSQTVSAVTEATGTVRAEQLASVTSRVTANILEMRAAAGKPVESGETLVVLDDRDLRRRVEQLQEAIHGAEAAVQGAAATLAQAQSDYRRDKPLFEQKVIPPFEFERTETGLKIAQANLLRLQQAQKEAEAALSSAEVALSYAVIRSPFAGVIVDKLADMGDLAAPGKPLFTIYQQGRLWLEAAVPEDLLAAIHPGAAMSVRIDARARDLRGTVVETVPSSDPATRTVAVRVHLEDTRDLVPGMFGRLLLPSAPERLLTVPAAAVIRAGQLTLTDVLERGRVERRTVQLGRALGDRFEVYSGLAEGESVVLNGAGAAARAREKS